jgi:CheY-like chemotaxis protein
MSAKPAILVVDDNPGAREILVLFLNEECCVVDRQLSQHRGESEACELAYATTKAITCEVP